MTKKEARKKALKIANMLGISVTTENEDGSKTIKQPKPFDKKEVNLIDIMNVIMES